MWNLYPCHWNQDCPRSDTCKAELQQGKWHFVLIAREIQSHSFPVGPSEGRKTHHMIINVLIITQFLLNLPPVLIFIPACREATQGARFQGKWVYNRFMPNLSANKHFGRLISFQRLRPQILYLSQICLVRFLWHRHWALLSDRGLGERESLVTAVNANIEPVDVLNYK